MDKSSSQRTAIDIISAFFFLIILFLPGLSLRSADWTDHLGVVTSLGMFGALSGIALVWSIFSGRTIVFFSSVYFVFAMGWLLGNTLDPALIWRDRIIMLLGRIGVFVGTIFRGERNQDPLMFVLLMGILFWFMGCFGEWAIFRRNGFWAAVVPPGLALVVNQILYLGTVELDGYLIFYMFLILILASRLDIWRRQQIWQRLRAQVAPNTVLAFSRAGLILAIAIVLLAWGGPVFAQSSQITNFWDVITTPFAEIRDKLSDTLGGLRGTVGVSHDLYGESLRLEAGVRPSDMMLMNVKVTERPENDGRFYWYSRAYNLYESGRWTISIGQAVDFDPDEGDLHIPEYEARQKILVEIFPQIPSMRGLYIPSQPIWSSRSGEADLYQIPDGTVDVIRITTRHAIRNGESYKARGSVATPSASQLREASMDYPQWLVDNYLQVPISVTERTRDLAVSITEGLDNPFDKAVAITRWLRENIQYQRVTIPPPEGIEELDWFLFDYKVGFCNWYASAEVILLRTLDIPSRLAVGYARGTYLSSEGYYEVREEDAHTWPEVYFPGYGWVEFEPTTIQSELDRPEELIPSEITTDTSSGETVLPDDRLDRLEDIDIPGTSEQGELQLTNQFDPRILVFWFLISICVLTAFLLIWMWINPMPRMTALTNMIGGLERIGIQPPILLRIAYQNRMTSTAKIYSRWTIWLRRLGITIHHFQTPYERAYAFGHKFPAASELGWEIVNTYVAERFGGVHSIEDDLKKVWRELRPFLMIEWFRGKTGL